MLPALVSTLAGALSTVAGADLQQVALPPPSAYGIAEPALQVQLQAPSSVCVDPSAAGRVLIASTDAHKCIRRLAPSSGTVTVVAGTPAPENTDAGANDATMHRSASAPLSGRAAEFSGIDCLLPAQLCDASEPLVYVSSMLEGTVRSFNPRTRTWR